MAKYPIYTIRDKVKGFDPQLLLDMNEQSAVRGFSYRINNADFMNFTPADYDLFYVGTFDTESGEIETELPRFIVNGASVLNEK